MTLSNVKLILAREIRDQLRDRRTMFMIFVLPLLLYPLMGLSLSRITQFLKQQPTKVLVAGAAHLEDLPPLLENKRFASGLFADQERAKLLDLYFLGTEPKDRGRPETPQQLRDEVHRRVQSGEYDAGVFFPEDFTQRLQAFRAHLLTEVQAATAAPTTLEKTGDEEAAKLKFEVPSPEIIYNTANEKSLIAFARLSEVMRRWTDRIGESNLAQTGVPVEAARPFSLEMADVATRSGLRGAATWAKILPMLLVVWAMTGAFYPAVDLCAGEKERGTLETLLSSPAQRSEIVVGKLLTIMLFSMATAILNVLSIGLTGLSLMKNLPNVGPPPWMALVWLPIALVPVSALFSALCLALAALARSTKEGQYYLVPLMLVTLPLVVLPMSPGVDLTLGNSLIPVMGLVLFLRTLLEGHTLQALPYLLPVAAVTLGCCVLAVRWAVEQFNKETVLFRESEQLDVAAWLRRTLREKRATPSPTMAVVCGVTILVIQFFVSSVARPPESAVELFRSAVLVQVVVIALPAILFAMFLTRSPRQTLLLRLPPPAQLLAAAGLAMVAHPAMTGLQQLVLKLYPVSDYVEESLGGFQQMLAAAPLWQLLLVIALTPAICEELAFRGFVLSGLRHLGRTWRAIAITSLFFAVAHSVLQQSMIAFLVGLVIGLIAVRSGSILPCILFHFVHNGLAVSTTKITPQVLDRWPALRTLLYTTSDGGFAYYTPVILVSAGLAAALTLWFLLQRFDKTDEERQAQQLRLAEDRLGQGIGP
ncbi:MAG: ABC transporter permease subunit/CPBP intramembrane protease [Planctomycetota bacterium]